MALSEHYASLNVTQPLTDAIVQKLAVYLKSGQTGALLSLSHIKEGVFHKSPYAGKEQYFGVIAEGC